jgi:transposase-like protein
LRRIDEWSCCLFPDSGRATRPTFTEITRSRTTRDLSFKQKAVELAAARGNAREFAEELGIPANLIYHWRLEALQFGTNNFPGAAAQR